MACDHPQRGNADRAGLGVRPLAAGAAGTAPATGAGGAAPAGRACARRRWTSRRTPPGAGESCGAGPRKPVSGSLGGVFGLAVGPSSRRRGYGTALLSRAAGVAATAGADRLAINAAPLGAELCAARGFELIGRGQQLTLDLR
ncbi:GNAT family N-acetyltransferase [Arthrobacter sp. ATA002]|uniref:GNAT family N-acetyltransferase n=1 Tax=Arthrobacter sp. ATA002 TaxID=2991715 RepID=UPI0022A7BB40|nr:GNAT family N-acetyltransferase [Arthrobacter sp. ATA002]WAP53073.1 GNAT family N-acetyltransferase [Arthrobacter sp. ATA002]